MPFVNDWIIKEKFELKNAEFSYIVLLENKFVRFLLFSVDILNF